MPMGCACSCSPGPELAELSSPAPRSVQGQPGAGDGVHYPGGVLPQNIRAALDHV